MIFPLEKGCGCTFSISNAKSLSLSLDNGWLFSPESNSRAWRGMSQTHSLQTFSQWDADCPSIAYRPRMLMLVCQPPRSNAFAPQLVNNRSFLNLGLSIFWQAFSTRQRFADHPVGPSLSDTRKHIARCCVRFSSDSSGKLFPAGQILPNWHQCQQPQLWRPSFFS